MTPQHCLSHGRRTSVHEPSVPSVSDGSYVTFSAPPKSTAGLMKDVMSETDWLTSNPEYMKGH